MNWLNYIMLGGGMILLGLAIVFLLFAEMVKRAQASDSKTKRKSSQQRGPSPCERTFDAESSQNEGNRAREEVSIHERAALGISGKEPHPQSRPTAEDSAEPDKSRPS